MLATCVSLLYKPICGTSRIRRMESSVRRSHPANAYSDPVQNPTRGSAKLGHSPCEGTRR